MANIDSFLTPMDVPALGNNFATDFTAFCNAIIQNFQKICSAPFLKGDRGSRAEMIEEPLIEDGEWTDFAKELVRSIYKDVPGNDPESPTPNDPPLPLKSGGTFIEYNDEGYDIVKGVDGGFIINNGDYIYSWQMLIDMCDDENPSIPVYYDQWTGNKEFWVPFFFFDGRTPYISEMPNENLSGYYDMSCTVIGKYEPESWTMAVSSTLPKLYYDEGGEFCWEIGGLKTGITAQGIQGEPGRTPNFGVCTGTLSENYINLPNNIGLQPGDIVLVFYNDGLDEGAQMGIVKGSDPLYIDNNPDYNILRQINADNLKTLLNTIGRDDTETVCAALYSPNPENPTADEVMALWVKDEDKHYIAPMRYADMGSTSGLNNDPLDKELEIKYSKTTFNGNVEIKGKSQEDNTDYRFSVLTNILGLTEDIDNGCIYVPVELIIGWISNAIAPDSNISDNNQPLDIFRAQKYNFTLNLATDSNHLSNFVENGSTTINFKYYGGYIEDITLTLNSSTKAFKYDSSGSHIYNTTFPYITPTGINNIKFGIYNNNYGKLNNISEYSVKPYTDDPNCYNISLTNRDIISAPDNYDKSLLTLSCSGYEITDLFFLQPNIIILPSPTSLQMIYPLYNGHFSFLSYPAFIYSNQPQYITRKLSDINIFKNGDISTPEREFHDIINKTYYETIYPNNFNPYILSPNLELINRWDYIISRHPYNAPIRIYPDNVMACDRDPQHFSN